MEINGHGDDKMVMRDLLAQVKSYDATSTYHLGKIWL